VGHAVVVKAKLLLTPVKLVTLDVAVFIYALRGVTVQVVSYKEVVKMWNGFELAQNKVQDFYEYDNDN
jgi:hypothetical protein